MVKHLSISTGFGFSLLIAAAAYAQSGKAPCGAFQKLPDGNWSVVRAIKIEHGTGSAMLNPGKVISPGTQVAGVNIYAALRKNCPATGSN